MTSSDALYEPTYNFLMGEMIHLSFSRLDHRYCNDDGSNKNTVQKQIEKDGVKKFLKKETRSRVKYLRSNEKDINKLFELINDDEEGNCDEITDMTYGFFRELMPSGWGGMHSDDGWDAEKRLTEFLREVREML